MPGRFVQEPQRFAVTSPGPNMIYSGAAPHRRGEVVPGRFVQEPQRFAVTSPDPNMIYSLCLKPECELGRAVFE